MRVTNSAHHGMVKPAEKVDVPGQRALAGGDVLLKPELLRSCARATEGGGRWRHAREGGGPMCILVIKRSGHGGGGGGGGGRTAHAEVGAKLSDKGLAADASQLLLQQL